MASRRGAAGRSEDRDRDEHSSRKVPHKEPVRTTITRAPPLDEFWLDGADIDRQVLQSSICRFLGPEATSRPFDHEGKPGYKIRAVRPFTPQMLEDLKERSREFILEARASKGRNGELRYEDSQTRRRGDAPDEIMDFEPTPIPHTRAGTYSSPNNTSGYPAQYVPEVSMPHTSAMFPPATYAYAQPQYAAQSGFSGPPGGYNDHRAGYQTDQYQYPTSREGPPPGNYGYGQPTTGGYGGSSRAPDIPMNYGYPPDSQPRLYNDQPPYGYDPNRGHPNPQGGYGQQQAPSRGMPPGQPPYEPPRDYGRPAQSDPYASHQQQRRR